jgi:hypothetical protein
MFNKIQHMKRPKRVTECEKLIEKALKI